MRAVSMTPSRPLRCNKSKILFFSSVLKIVDEASEAMNDEGSSSLNPVLPSGLSKIVLEVLSILLAPRPMAC